MKTGARHKATDNKNKHRLLRMVLCAMLFALCCSVNAQQPAGKVFRIGFLTGARQAASNPNFEAFLQGLREFGYIEGKNIIIEYRGSAGELGRIPDLAAELVGLEVDIIVTTGMPAVVAAKRATSTIPIVTANADNLVEAGIVASLDRPGGNITGTNRVDVYFSTSGGKIHTGIF